MENLVLKCQTSIFQHEACVVDLQRRAWVFRGSRAQWVTHQSFLVAISTHLLWMNKVPWHISVVSIGLVVSGLWLWWIVPHLPMLVLYTTVEGSLFWLWKKKYVTPRKKLPHVIPPMAGTHLNFMWKLQSGIVLGQLQTRSSRSVGVLADALAPCST